MEILTIKKEKKTPFIELDPARGVLTIEGRSIPENPESFYNVVYSSMEKYYNHPRSLPPIIFSSNILIPVHPNSS
jgi:hypothetical protein